MAQNNCVEAAHFIKALEENKYDIQSEKYVFIQEEILNKWIAKDRYCLKAQLRSIPNWSEKQLEIKMSDLLSIEKEMNVRYITNDFYQVLTNIENSEFLLSKVRPLREFLKKN